MFFIINKEKLESYIISVATVIILFIMAGSINSNRNVIETSANIQNETNINSTNSQKNNVKNYTGNIKIVKREYFFIKKK